MCRSIQTTGHTFIDRQDTDAVYVDGRGRVRVWQDCEGCGMVANRELSVDETREAGILGLCLGCRTMFPATIFGLPLASLPTAARTMIREGLVDAIESCHPDDDSVIY